MANLPVIIFQFAMSPYADWQVLTWGGALLITVPLWLEGKFWWGGIPDPFDSGRPSRPVFQYPNETPTDYRPARVRMVTNSSQV